MNIQTDTYPATPPAVVATVPHRRRKTTLVALGLVTFLAIGAGVGAAALIDDGSGSTARPPTAAAAVATSSDADALWSYLTQLPPAERDAVLIALIPDPTGALGAIGAGMLITAG